MPGTEELLSRLQRLEDGYYGDKEAARQQQFFDTYGARFSNNRGLGLAILNELDARGIDTSAADEAVTQILDQLRTECNEIIESIKDVQQTAIDNAQKVEAIQDVVSQAAANNPEASIDPNGGEMPTAEGMEVPPDAVVDENMPVNVPEEMPPEGGDVPPEEMPPEGGEMPPEGGEVPPEGGEMPMPPEGGEMPPEEGGEMYQPSADMLSAVSGGRY
ncbi:MAG: hypothetical protein J6M63_11010 [Pseudobutyrivibrio sp.]|nr:hypothetical protein [Pseudobutyrivibrio sp.]